MIAPARRVAFELLQRIEAEGLFCDAAVNSPELARLETRDRHLTTELIMGTLRWQGLLDFVLSAASSRAWDEIDATVRCLLRLSLYQMWKLERVPDHAAVNDAVELAKARAGLGAAGFLNAILRRLGRERPWERERYAESLPPWVRVSLPRWLWDRWSARYGAEAAQQYALSLNEPPRVAVRMSASWAGRDPAADGMTASELVPGACFMTTGDRSRDGVLDGYLIQDEASQLIPHLLGPITGWLIWDVCGAPGGKSAILCENAGKQGCIVSSDRSWRRTKMFARAISDPRGWGPKILVLDARQQPPFRKQFDAVVADVPCSGLGTLRRNADIKWRFEAGRLASLQTTQKAILSSASEAVKPGGLILYSTCSTEPEENEDVVRDFLDSHPGFTQVPPLHPPGVSAFLDLEGSLRTFPGTRLWDGFFAALIRRSPIRV